jgi:hypothetical protein
MTFRSQFTPPEHELRSDDGPEKNRIEFEKEGSTVRTIITFYIRLSVH